MEIEIICRQCGDLRWADPTKEWRCKCGTWNRAEIEIQPRNHDQPSNMPPGHREALLMDLDTICLIHAEYFLMDNEGGCPSCISEWHKIEDEDA